MARCLEGRMVHLRQRAAIFAQTGVVTAVPLVQRCLKSGNLKAVQLVPGNVFELAEMQHLLASEWNLVRTRVARIASGHCLSIGPAPLADHSGFASHPEWTRLHLQGDDLVGDLRCSPAALPFENDSLQLIVARHIGDALDPGSGIEAELARILAPGGVLFLFGLNPLSPWRFWLSRQARQGWRLPGRCSAARMRETLAALRLEIARREFLGGAWPMTDGPAAERPATGAIWHAAWLLAARKQRTGMRPIPLSPGMRRAPLNHGLAQSPSQRVSP
jgi:SAM-dependent methyltransferase